MSVWGGEKEESDVCVFFILQWMGILENFDNHLSFWQEL